MTNIECAQQLARLHARLARLECDIYYAKSAAEAQTKRNEWLRTDAQRLRLLAESKTEVEV